MKTKHLIKKVCLNHIRKILKAKKLMAELEFVIPGEYCSKSTINSDEKDIIRVICESDDYENEFELADGRRMAEDKILRDYVYVQTWNSTNMKQKMSNKKNTDKRLSSKLLSGIGKDSAAKQELPKEEQKPIQQTHSESKAPANEECNHETKREEPIRYVQKRDPENEFVYGFMQKIIMHEEGEDIFSPVVFKKFGIDKLKASIEMFQIEKDKTVDAYVDSLFEDSVFRSIVKKGILQYIDGKAGNVDDEEQYHISAKVEKENESPSDELYEKISKLLNDKLSSFLSVAASNIVTELTENIAGNIKEHNSAMLDAGKENIEKIQHLINSISAHPKESQIQAEEWKQENTEEQAMEEQPIQVVDKLMKEVDKYMLENDFYK